MKTRRGFATTMALALVVLAGMALTALTLRINAAALQTRAAQDDAQLKQLLLAATRAAAANQERIALPAELSDARVTIINKGDQSEIEATLGERRMAQVVDFDNQRKVTRIILK
jgi:hypothetical protein